MNDEYVRKDVFDAKIETIDAKIKAVEDTAGIAIQDTRDRIEDIHASISRGMTIVSIVIAASALFLAGVQWYLSLPHCLEVML